MICVAITSSSSYYLSSKLNQGHLTAVQYPDIIQHIEANIASFCPDMFVVAMCAVFVKTVCVDLIFIGCFKSRQVWLNI